MKTQNLAILLTDIAGFTAATSKQTRDENAAWLTMHGQLLRPIFQAFGGTVIKEIGDAFLTVFPSPTDAVLCGTALLDRLWAYNQTAPPLMRFNVRVVVNMGEVRLDKGDIYGEPVNVAARVEDVAEGGDVTITEAVFLTMNRSEVELEPLGSQTLKGLPEPVTLYRVKQLAERPAAGELSRSYPFGGTQLHRLATPGSAPTAELKTGSDGGLAALKQASSRARSMADAIQLIPGRMVARLGLMVVLLGLLGGAGFGGWKWFTHWRNDPFRAIEERLAAGDFKGASAAWDRADIAKAKPAWKLEYYLGRVSALEGACGDVLDAYTNLLKEHGEVASDEALNRDVVHCLEGSSSKRAAKLIRSRLGKDSVPALAALAKEKTRPAAARLAALELLSGMEAVDSVNQPRVLVQILDGDDACNDRREAVLKLASLKAGSALDDLRRIQRESDSDEGKKAKQNRCLVGALGEAIRAIEEAN